MSKDSGVGVIDKSVSILATVAQAPATLAELVDRTGIPRPTAHRLARALEMHALLDRGPDGRFAMGPRIAAWAADSDPLHGWADAVVTGLRDATGVSAQVYRRSGDRRLCVAAAEPAVGLRDTVPVGSFLTLKAGSAAQVLAAWLPPRERSVALRGAAFSAADLARVRDRGWAHTIGQREPGVASVSVPARQGDSVVAAVSVSGPIERLTRVPATLLRALREAADTLPDR